MPLSLFHPLVAEWFQSALGAPTRCQREAWPPLCRGESTLVLAPTGSGKTLAAFLVSLDRLLWSPVRPREQRCRVLYVSPLKALAVDIERNLRSPLADLAQLARSQNVDIRLPIIDVRTGDTPSSERARMLRSPPDILITTPESLYLLLTSRARAILGGIETVIVDEIHSLAPTKRGSHLFVSLERLERLRGTAPPLQRLGLSATQRPLTEIARLLGGFDSTGNPRAVTVIDAGEPKRLDLSVEVPDVDLGRIGQSAAPFDDPEKANSRFSLWPHIHARVVELIRQHRTTLVFVNSRRVAERVASALNTVAGCEIALAHHGSIAREKRLEIENRLKQGDLPALVATSSLELGIDMGAVDLVIQIEAPSSVSSGIQRIGRACHGVGGIPRGVLMAKHRADLLACAAAAQAIRTAAIEETRYPRNPLDVLAQQIVAIASEGTQLVDDVYSLVRQAAPFSELPRRAFEDVLDMLSGLYPSEQLSDLRPRLHWDRAAGTLRAREGARRIAIANGGTIPERGLYGVFLAGEGGSTTGGMRVGELDEEMVFELRLGEVFFLGASSWRTETITHDRVIVSPAPGEPGKMPFWHGDRPGRTRALGDRLGKLAREIADSKPEQAQRLLEQEYHLDEHAQRNLCAFVQDQLSAAGEVSSDQTILVERYKDEVGDWRVCVLSPFGLSVHAPWSLALRARLESVYAGTDVHLTDDGMVFRLPACDEPPRAELFFPPSQQIEQEVTAALGGSALFAARFRECAARALLLPRRSPTRRTPLWAQRRRAGDLLAVTSRFPSFPIVLEAYRECLSDVFDLPGLKNLLQQVERRHLRVATIDSLAPSPFALGVLFSFVANFLYLLDAPVAERKAQVLRIDPGRLRELLGDTEARELLDREVLETLESQKQGLTHPVRTADGLHDLLLRIGDLDAVEVAARCSQDPSPWLDQLQKENRVLAVCLAGTQRYIAAEDSGRYHGALGIPLPGSLPDAFLAPGEAPLVALVGRYARTHGPFDAQTVALRFGAELPDIDTAIVTLLHSGRLASGAFLPKGTTTEYCDVEILRQLRARSLARLRHQVEPVPHDAYVRFLLHWQGLARKRRGQDALLSVVQQLQGCPLVASALESEILPARLEQYSRWDLDALCAAGEIVWVGLEPLGPNDARIALYLAEQEALLARPPAQAEGELPSRLRALLSSKGALFFKDVVRELGGYPGELLDALWSLVWSGELTNDTFEPLRSRIRSQTRSLARPEPLRRSSAGPAGSEGRWSLRSLRWKDQDNTARSLTLARTLLDRYGVVVREVAEAEELVGGFSAVYPVLKALEESGGVRRGYFVEGRGGAQFALPGADEQLRALRSSPETATVLLLSAVDIANPYGTLLDWPSPPNPETTARPQRTAGARVVLWKGKLVAWLGRAEQGLLTFLPEDEPDRREALQALGKCLVSLVDRRHRRALLLTSIDGRPASESPLAPALLQLGFVGCRAGLLAR